jgi:hypothetical protein
MISYRKLRIFIYGKLIKRRMIKNLMFQKDLRSFKKVLQRKKMIKVINQLLKTRNLPKAKKRKKSKKKRNK